MSHNASPLFAPALESLASSSLASDARARARFESLSAEAVATSAAATTSATKGFCASAYSELLFFAAFLSFFFFLSVDTAALLATRCGPRSYPYSSQDCNKRLFQFGDMPWMQVNAGATVVKR
jgi:hypothetical protein